MANIDIGAREGAFGALFQNLGAAFQSQIEANQRGAAAKARLDLDKKKFKVQQEQLKETKKKNTMNAAIKRLISVLPGGELYSQLGDASKTRKLMAKQFFDQGFPEMAEDKDSHIYKTIISGLLEKGPHIKAIISSLDSYANLLTANNRRTALSMGAHDPGALPDVMEWISETAEANKVRMAKEKAMQDLSPTGGRPGMGRDAVESYESPQETGSKSLRAYQKLVNAGVDPSKVAHLLNREKTARSGEKIIQETLNLAGKTALIRSTDGTTRSVPLDQVREVLLAEPDAQVFGPGSFSGTDLTSVLVPKRQAGKVRGTRVKMAGLMSKSKILLDAFERLGSGIGGIRGTFGNIVGGIAGQISPILGEIVTKGITGASPQELAHFRSDAQALIAETVPVYTGEESGRISEPELRISKQATKVLAGTASQAEIVGALKSIINATFLKSERALIETSGELTWGFIRPDGSRDDRAAAFAYDKIKKVSKMDKTAVLSILSDLATQQRSLILGGLWKGLEAQ